MGLSGGEGETGDGTGKVTPNTSGPAGRDGADGNDGINGHNGANGQDGSDGNDFLVDNIETLENSANESLTSLPTPSPSGKSRDDFLQAKEAYDKAEKSSPPATPEELDSLQHKLDEARKEYVDELKASDSVDPEVKDAIKANDELEARKDFDANTKFREDEENSGTENHEEPDESEHEAENKEFKEKLEPWEKAIEKLTFWSTFVEARLLGVQITLEKLGGVTTHTATSVEATAEDISEDIVWTANPMWDPSAGVAGAEMELEAAADEVEESAEGLTHMGLGLMVLGITVAAATSATLQASVK
ncbi:MAG: hypothetical protein AB8B55_13350 [Mariniblastus sp.]